MQRTPQAGLPAPPSRQPQQDEEVALPLSYCGVPWCLQAGSNRRPLPFQGSALPTELQRHWCGAWLRYNHISRFARVSSLRWFLCSLCAPCCTIFAASTLDQPHRACRGGRTHMSCWTPRFKLGAYAVPPGRRCFAAYPSPDSNREHTRSKRAASARLG